MSSTETKSEVAAALRESLTPNVARPYCNEFGDWIWLRPLIRMGRRCGLTHCCYCDAPCKFHGDKAGPS